MLSGLEWDEVKYLQVNTDSKSGLTMDALIKPTRHRLETGNCFCFAGKGPKYICQNEFKVIV